MSHPQDRTLTLTLSKIAILCWALGCASLVLLPPRCQAYPTYGSVTRLFDDLLGNESSYNHAVRPLLDQSLAITVNVTFDIIAIVEIDAIQQKFIVNGFLGLFWQDELLTWTPSDYQYAYLIHPYPNQIWRPRLILANTLDDRDLFEDDYSPVIVLYDGNVSWFPGSLFPTSCKLNLYKFPFDTQTCNIDMYSMGMTGSEIVFTPTVTQVSDAFYVESGEWKIEATKIIASSKPGLLSFFRIEFTLRRLPGFFIVNIVAPIVLMSFLNILVFLIPVESGEKISYGITVLLALTVFMSIVSSELPRSSDILPLVTIYLLVLTVISVCTVIVSVTIVYFHHREEKEAKRQKATKNFKGIFNKIRLMNRTASSFSQVKPAKNTQTTDHVTMVSEHNSLHPDDKSTPDKTESVLNVMNKLKLKAAGVGNRSRPSSDNTRRMNGRVGSGGVGVGGVGGGNSNDGGAGGVGYGYGGGGVVYFNRWRQIGKHMDFVSFVVFTVVWISVTIGFLVSIAS